MITNKNVLNPIFEPKAAREIPKEVISLPANRSENTSGLKFPVTKAELREFKRAASNKGLGQFQSRYNSSVLVEALIEPLERCWETDYKDTGRYLTVLATKAQARKIEQLAQFWGVSKREAMQRVMVSTMSRGMIKNDGT